MEGKILGRQPDQKSDSRTSSNSRDRSKPDMLRTMVGDAKGKAVSFSEKNREFSPEEFSSSDTSDTEKVKYNRDNKAIMEEHQKLFLETHAKIETLYPEVKHLLPENFHKRPFNEKEIAEMKYNAAMTFYNFTSEGKEKEKEHLKSYLERTEEVLDLLENMKKAKEDTENPRP